MIVNIALVVLVFGGLIFFHELGHFLFARLFGMGVKTFSLGFGKILWSKVWGKTRYQVALLPFGGYVALVGETPTAEIPEPFTPQESFSLRPAWQRFFVIFAGSFFNLILAWIVFTGLYFSYGEQIVEPVVTGVVADSPAAAAGLQAGDRIISIDGTPIVAWDDMLTLVQFSQGKTLNFSIQRENAGLVSIEVAAKEQQEVTKTNRKVSFWTVGIAGVSSGVKTYTLYTASVRGVKEIERFIGITLKGMKGLITRNLPSNSMQGPMGIVQTIYEQADGGFYRLLKIMALLSVALGTFNLFPVPVLDGGHLFFLVIEMIFRRPVPVAVQEKSMMIGLFLLLALMVFATYNDVMNFF